MPKIAWVAAPLLAALGWWLWRLARGRPPSRLALNVASSLLLLAYLGATAGLGIFWVAQQQLPVFDWHYLFGYGTLLLLALHLVLNGPLVWRYLRQRWGGGAAGRRPGAAAAWAAGARAGAVGAGRGEARLGGVGVGVVGAAGSRRKALAWVGAGVLAAGAIAWAWRAGHAAGRRAGHDAALAALAARGAGDTDGGGGAAYREADAAGLALVERFQSASSSARRGGLPAAPPVSWGDPPPPFKAVGGPRRPLPPPARAPAAAAAPLTAAEALSTALWHTAAVTERRGGLLLRAAPSSGALWATELAVLAQGVEGLADGVWHHDAAAHALVRLPGAVPPGVLQGAPMAVVATAIFRRTGYKYRDRTWRYVLADLGHALENLRLGARAAGWTLELLPAFDDTALAAALGIDGVEEGVLMVARLAPRPGAGAAPPILSHLPARVGELPAATAPAALPGSAAPAAAPAAAARLQPAAAGLGLTGTVHVASRWPPGRRPPPPVPADVQPGDPPGNPLALIARRRSRRRFAPLPLPRAALQTVLVGLQADRPLLSPALRVHVVVHAVEGLAPGAWDWDAARGRLQPRRRAADAAALRRVSRAAALDQDVVGDAAAVLVLGIARRDWTADAGGPLRGYRHALLEAGLVGERWYLQAEAAGLGACGVGAFFDDEAAALVGVDAAEEWIVHFAALGLRAADGAAG